MSALHRVCNNQKRTTHRVNDTVPGVIDGAIVLVL